MQDVIQDGPIDFGITVFIIKSITFLSNKSCNYETMWFFILI